VTLPLVVKLGGSFARAGDRAGWLAAIAPLGGRAVLVPGGGPFADAVRAQQPVLGVSDRAAHRMALLAMAQFGIALAEFSPAFQPAASEAAIRAALAAGRVPVWLPMPDAAPGVAESWDVTSDSLALWLATRLGAARLLLVKQVPGGVELLDGAFRAMLPAFRGMVYVAGGRPPEALDPQAPPGLCPAAA
jgi:aspartokinase-like uncharacterized kinase